MQRPFSRYFGIPWGGGGGLTWPVPPRRYCGLWWALPVGIVGFVLVSPTDMCPSLYPLHLQSPCLLNRVDLKSASRRTGRRHHSGTQSLWALALGQPGHQSWFLSY